MKSRLLRKSDKVWKGYTKDIAINDERLLLFDVAIQMWERFQFDCVYENKPLFGDLKTAARFKDEYDVDEYFLKKAKGQVKQDEIKECLTKEEWFCLMIINSQVNSLFNRKLTQNEDGSIRLVLQKHFYNDWRAVTKNLVRKLYGPEKKVDIQCAASGSSVSP